MIELVRAHIVRIVLGICLVAALAGSFLVRVDWMDVVLNAQETSPVDTPTQTPAPGTPQALSTPTPSRRVVNEIIHPKAGDAAAGIVILIGTPLIQDFARYDVHIGVSGREDWQWLHSGYRVVRDDIIHVFDSTQFDDGPYDIRVRAINNRGDYNETFLRSLHIRNAAPPTATPLFNIAGTRVFVVPTQTPTPTPTPAPVNEARSSELQGFFAPRSGQIVQGYVPLVASVFGYPKQPFARYELDISPAGLSRWSQLDHGQSQHWQEVIYLLNTYLLPDGAYDLRLRNVYRDANYDEYFVRGLTVSNEQASLPGETDVQANGFVVPRAGQTVGGAVRFEGTALADDFLRWELYWSPAGGEAWAYLTMGEEQVLQGPLAVLDLSQLPSGAYDFRLRVVRRDFNYDDYAVRGVQIVPPTPTPFVVATLTPVPTQ